MEESNGPAAETPEAGQPGAEATLAPDNNTEVTGSEDPYAITEGGEEVQPETIYADKFKSVSELEKSYLELQSTFSKKMGEFKGAPEDGYNLGEDYTLLPNEEPLVDFLQDWGKEHQLSQEGFESLVTKYTEVQDQLHEQQLQQEYQKLGNDADYRLENVRNFLEANVGKDLTEQLASTMMSAAAIEAVEKLIDMTKAPKPVQAPTTALNPDKVRAMRFATNENGDRLMSVDPNYRAKVLRLEAQLLKQ
jgi:hypothetical protein